MRPLSKRLPLILEHMSYRIKIKQYALALAELMKDGKIGDKNSIANFVKLLEKNKDLKSIAKIVEAAEKYYLKNRGNKKIILETARKTDVKSVLKNIYKEGDVIEEKINPDLVAGIKVNINNEKEFDASLIGKLRKLF